MQLFDDDGQPVRAGEPRLYAFKRVITEEFIHGIPREHIQRMIAEYSGQLLTKALLDPLADVSHDMGVWAEQAKETSRYFGDYDYHATTVTVYLRCPMNMDGYRALENRRMIEHYAGQGQLDPSMVAELKTRAYNPDERKALDG